MFSEKKTFEERTNESINKEYNIEEDCDLLEHGGCCCVCDDHHETHTHCSTVSKEQREELNAKGPGCACGHVNGYMCRKNWDGEMRNYINWSKHSMCEMFGRKPDFDTSENERDIIAFVKAAKRSKSLSKFLQKYINSRAVVCQILWHDKLNAKQLQIIFDQYKDKKSEVDVLMLVARNDFATPEMLEFLSDHASLFVRERIARNENTPERVLEKMCETEKVPTVLYQMIHNSALTPKIAGLVIPLLPKDKEGHNMNQLYIKRLNDFIETGKKNL